MWTKIEYTGDNFQDNSMKNSDDFSSESDENLKKKLLTSLEMILRASIKLINSYSRKSMKICLKL